MIKKLTLAAIALLLSMTTTLNHATEFGTEAQAKAMIERAINLVNIDKVRALDAFTDLDGGFGYKDLYVFCFNKKGILLAHPTNLGADASGLMDEDGLNIWSLVSSTQKGEIKKLHINLCGPPPIVRRCTPKPLSSPKLKGCTVALGFTKADKTFGI